MDLPNFLPPVLFPLWTQLLAWFNAQVYARLLSPDEFWVRLAAHLKLAPLEQACAAYQHTGGPGCLATHTVPHLVRALLVKYLRNLSLRELEAEIRTHVVVKWFVGYTIFERGPDHSTLERFEQWVIAQQSRTFFDEVRDPRERILAHMRRDPMEDAERFRAYPAALVKLLRAGTAMNWKDRPTPLEFGRAFAGLL